MQNVHGAPWCGVFPLFPEVPLARCQGPIGDPTILRLVRKWLNAGILDQGQVNIPEEGTPQGGALSPVLANIYLHYGLDLWFERVVRPRCRGNAQLIRFADD